MQCLRHHHLDVKRELQGGAGGRIDAHQWKASREKVNAWKIPGCCSREESISFCDVM